MESNSHSPSWSASSAPEMNTTSRDVNAGLTFSTLSNDGPNLAKQSPPNEIVTNISSTSAHNYPVHQNVRHSSLQAAWTPYNTFHSRPASSRLGSYSGAVPHAGSMSTHRRSKSLLSSRNGVRFAPPAPPTTPITSPVYLMHNDSYDRSPDTAFSNLRSNYLNMLSKNPDAAEEPASMPSSMPATPASTWTIPTPPYPAAEASPQTRQYVASPNDSPSDDFLQTPNGGTPGDMSPVVAEYGSTFGDLPLFSHHVALECKPACHPPVVSYPNFDELYSMPDSPRMPSLDRSSLYDEPLAPSTTQRRTITKRKITPESLIPIDAPTQPRVYKTPSATSRKEVPALFARKRSRSQAFGEEDQLADESGGSAAGEPAVSPSEAELIEAKRRQNTIAARKSRKRKLEYVMDLEDSVKRLTKERDMWRSRALTSETVLKHHGLAIPQYSEL